MSADTKPVIKDISDLHQRLGRTGLIDRLEASCPDYHLGENLGEVRDGPRVHPAAPPTCANDSDEDEYDIPPPTLPRRASDHPPKPRLELTIKSPREIAESIQDDRDLILGDRVIARGQSTTLIGASGLGKSTMALQAACCMAAGIDFLNFKNHAGPLKVLFLQNENSHRRIQNDLNGMAKHFGSDYDLVSENLLIQTPESEMDFDLCLDSERVEKRVAGIVKLINPDVVILDPLNNFTSGDLNSDQIMRSICMRISKVCRSGNLDRAVILLHHALTGKAGASRASGFDRNSHGRNSKILHAWTRASINLAPADPDDNGRLVVTCGKNSNGAEFRSFGIRLDPGTRTYAVDPCFDMESWQQELTGKPGKNSLKPKQVAALIGPAGITRAALVELILEAGLCEKSDAYKKIALAEKKGLISRDETNKLLFSA